jgi:hypothetical protein
MVSLWNASKGAAFSDAVSAQSHTCRAGRAPKQFQTPEYAAVTNYAYHLDAAGLASMLKEHCIKRLGVTYVSDHVVGASLSADGWLHSVSTRDNGEIEADVFVDCSGRAALLIGDKMNAPLTDVSEILFNDRALAIHVPYSESSTEIPSQTNATAASAGWIWDIALQSRRGVGYVYSSRHTDEAEARSALSDYLANTAPGCNVSGVDARLLKFRSEYRATPWVKNVVAIGMSQGFVEPLEASAIVMVELSAAMLSDSLPSQTGDLHLVSQRFNQRFAYRWARIVDFLKLHYILSDRPEPYWRDQRAEETWPERLRELMGRWKAMPPSREDFSQSQEIFPAASYAYVLYGMGFETQTRSLSRRKDDPSRAGQRLAEIANKAEKLLAGLPSNRALLDHICDRVPAEKQQAAKGVVS